MMTRLVFWDCTKSTKSGWCAILGQMRKNWRLVDRTTRRRRFPAERIAEEGLFEALLEGVSEAFEYLVEVTTWSGETFTD